MTPLNAFIIFIGTCLVLWGVIASVPEKQEPLHSEPPTNRVVILQEETTDGKQLKNRSWRISSPEKLGRFYEMTAMVNGDLKVIGAWDTDRHEALLLPEYADFFKKP